MSATLSVRGLSAGYGALRVLDRLDLDVRAGRLTALVGPNGAGKSTLLKALSGLIPRTGEVDLDGVPLPESPAAAVARGLGHVPEGRQLFAEMTVHDNLELGAWGRPKRERTERLHEVLQRFPRLADRRRQLAGSMSGGEQQMLAIGRALMRGPRLLMLDEPSLGLAPRLVDSLLTLVRELCDGGMTVLLVEQHVERALAMADDACLLERGRVVHRGPARDVLASGDVRTAYLGEVR